MNQKLARQRVIIRGRVQGVGFRWNTEDAARRLGLAGWVRNLPDGAVEAAFEGDATQVAKAVAWCRRGRPPARVDSVDVLDEPPEGLHGFSIR